MRLGPWRPRKDRVSLCTRWLGAWMVRKILGLRLGKRPGLRPHVLAQLVRSCACSSFMKDRTLCNRNRGPGDAIGCSAKLSDREAMSEQGTDVRTSGY
jgi:hypothetical protein